MTLLRVTDDTTRDEMLVALALLNAGAKTMSRRGKVGTLDERYARQHERIDALLEELELHP